MQKKWKTENIAIKNLSPWDENARFSDQYFNVPEHLYRGLMNASSHGQFLNDYIRNSYRYQKVNYDLRELKDMGVIESHGASVNVFYTPAF